MKVAFTMDTGKVQILLQRKSFFVLEKLQGEKLSKLTGCEYEMD
jgi:hypothetical protein